jgi:FAD/FMN-containing dehydrogenase
MKPGLDEKISAIRNGISGRVLLASDPDFDGARRVWNAMIDRCPGVIFQCADETDAIEALSFARENGLEISIRGGAHNIAGFAVCDGGVMIDFSRMKRVWVDAGARRAFAQPGATLHDFDEAVQAHGLATPVGINSTTGLAGLTLGGGFGWLTRQYGMTIDNLVSADVLLAEGRQVHASQSENDDLFWAIRGGGGNFGVVTQFEFGLHPVGPEIFAGLIVFPFNQAKNVLTRYREYFEKAPLALNAWVVLRQAPPLPFLPKDVHGKEVLVLAVFYAGKVADGETAIAPLRRFGDILGEHVGPQPYTQWQQTFDPLLTPGARNYWKSHNFIRLRDGVLDTMIEYASKLPSNQCEIFLGLIAGRANEVPATATAYGARDARFVLNVHGRWDRADDDERCIRWSRAFFNAAAPYASSGAYVNFMTEEEGERITAAYGPNYSRLLEIKQRYDPENIFHLNQNIRRPGKKMTAAAARRGIS